MMSCDRNGRKCAAAAVRNGIAGHAGRSLNAISSWQTVDTLMSGKVNADKLPEQAANLALGTVGLKVENGHIRLRNVMGLVIGAHALEHATGSAVTMLARTALRGQPVATYRGVLIRRSPLVDKWQQTRGKLSFRRVQLADSFYFHQGGRTWSVTANRYRFPGNLPEKTLTTLRSHSFPDRAFYFDRPLDPRDAVDIVLGHKDPATHPGFLGATTELDALLPAIKGAKQTLMAANWLTMDDSERDTRTLDFVDYGTLIRSTSGSATRTSPFYPSARTPAWRTTSYTDIAKAYKPNTTGIPIQEGYGGLKPAPEKPVDKSAFVGNLWDNQTKPEPKIERTSNYAQLVREVGQELAPETIAVSGKGERPLRVEALDQLSDKRILAEAYYRDTDGAWVPITDEKAQEKIANVIVDAFRRVSKKT